MGGTEKHIVVTTDFSEVSTKAFAEAKQLAELFGAEHARLTLLSVLEDVESTSLPYAFGEAVISAAGIMDRAREHAAEKMESLKETFFGDIEVETRILESKQTVDQAIVEFAKSEGADYLVLAAAGRSGIERFVLGSTAERILRAAPCPVVLVPSG